MKCDQNSPWCMRTVPEIALGLRNRSTNATVPGAVIHRCPRSIGVATTSSWALAAAASVNDTIRLGTGITLVAQRDPLWPAKQTSPLDTVWEGRFFLGIGYDWNKEEARHHGVDYSERRAVSRKNRLAVREIWTNDEVEFHGEHVDFDGSWSWSKPVQPGGPPVILGGNAGPKTIADIVEFCDGWMPIAGRYEFVDKIDEARRAAEDARRDPSEISFGQFGTPAGPVVASGLVSNTAEYSAPRGIPLLRMIPISAGKRSSLLLSAPWVGWSSSLW
jgi:hypothetical protein